MSRTIAMDGSGTHAAEADGHTELAAELQPSRRESLLLWFIGSIFGAGMIGLLVAMWMAEVSIQRGVSGQAAGSPVTSSAPR